MIPISTDFRLKIIIRLQHN